MRMKEWVLLLLTGVLTVGALSVWTRNAKKDEKEETKIEQTQDAKLDHSLFETEGTYTTRKLVEGDVIGGKWIRIMKDVDNMPVMNFSNYPISDSMEWTIAGIGIDPKLRGFCNSGVEYMFEVDGFESYESEDYVDIYLEEKTYNIVVAGVLEGTSTDATLTFTSETTIRSFWGMTGDVFFELIPN